MNSKAHLQSGHNQRSQKCSTCLEQQYSSNESGNSSCFFFHSPCHICLTLSSTSCGLSHPHPPSFPSLSSTYYAHPHKCSGGLSPSNKALDVDRQGRGGDKRPRKGYGLLGSQGRGWLLFTKAFKLKLTD